MQSFLDHVKWYGRRGLRVEYIIIVVLTGTAILQALYVLGVKVPSI